MEREATKRHEGSEHEDHEDREGHPPHTAFAACARRVFAAIRVHLRSPRVPATHRYLLRAMLDGATLKAHRDLDGAKTHMLHSLSGPAGPVDRAAVERLRRHGLIASNMKFPAATYVLTEAGRTLAQNFR